MKVRFFFFNVIVVAGGLGLYLSLRPGGGSASRNTPVTTSESFESLMNSGKNYYDKNDTEKAAAAFQKAVAARPTHPDAHLNLANAWLLKGDAEPAAKEAQEV